MDGGRGNGGLDGWIAAAQDLAEEGRLSWLLGRALAGALTGAAEGRAAATDQLRALVRGGVQPGGGTVAAGPETAAGANRKPADRSREKDGRAAPQKAWPPSVLFVGSQCVRGQWVSMAIGVAASGKKDVLGLWPGAAADAAVSGRLVRELCARGVDAAAGLLLIGDGSRALDRAAEVAWGARVILAHCRRTVLAQVVDHLPPAERGAAAAELWQAWARPVNEAQAALQGWIEHRGKAHPGAADRLRRSVEPTLAVARLGLPRPLEQSLVAAGAIRQMFERALELGGSRASGVAAVAAGLQAAVRQSRALMGVAGMPALVEQLRAHAAGGR